MPRGSKKGIAEPPPAKPGRDGDSIGLLQASSSSQQAELVLAIQEAKKHIERLQTLVKIAEDQCFALRIREVPAARLPDDVLRTIFEAGCSEEIVTSTPTNSPKEEKRPPAPQLIYSRVCRRWRNVSFDTSALWWGFVVESEHSLDFIAHMIPQLTCRFGIILRLPCKWTRTLSVAMKRAIALMTQQTSRLGVLKLQMCRHGLYNFGRGMKASFPQVRQLGWTRNTRCIDGAYGAESRGQGVYGAMPLFEEIATLDITSLSIPVLSAALPTVKTVRLQWSFDDSNGWSGSDASGETLRKFISMLPSLRHLDIARTQYPHRSRVDSPDCPLVGGPLLRNLETVSFSSPSDVSFVTKWLPPPYPSLREVCLHDCFYQAYNINPQTIAFLFRHLPALQRIYLCETRTGHTDSVVSEYLAAVIEALGETDETGNPLCPLLSEATFVYCARDSSGLKAFTDQLPSFLDRRKAIGASLHHFAVATHPAMDPSTRDALRSKVSLKLGRVPEKGYYDYPSAADVLSACIFE